MCILTQIQRQVRIYLAKLLYDRMLFDKEKHRLVRSLEKKAVFRTRFLLDTPPLTINNIKIPPIKIDKWEMRGYIHDAIHFFDIPRPVIEYRSATAIQRTYRGYRGRRRCVVRREMIRFQKMKQTLARRRKAAIDIQRVYRGRHGRIRAMDMKRGEQVIAIQRIWRGYIQRKRYNELRHHHEAATIIQKFVRRWMAHRKYLGEIGGYRRDTKATTIIASLFRSALTRRHLRQGLEYHRRLHERRSTALTIQNLRLQMVANKLMLESLYGDYSYSATYGKQTFVGEGRCLYQHFAQNKEEERLEGYGFLSSMRQSPGIISKTFTETDADLIFAR